MKNEIMFIGIIILILAGRGALYLILGEKTKSKEVEKTPGVLLCDEGLVTYDEAKERYFMKIRGMNFPFRADPCDAAKVKVISKNNPAHALVESLLGNEVEKVTLLTDPNDNNALKAADEIHTYLSLGRSGDIEWATTNEINLAQANKSNTIVYLKGPNSGAKDTKVTVEENKIVIEGKTYPDLIKAADRVILEVAAVFCGSATCKDPVACAAGKSCGCESM